MGLNRPLLKDKLVVSLMGVEREEDATAWLSSSDGEESAEAGETVDSFASGSKEFR